MRLVREGGHHKGDSRRCLCSFLQKLSEVVGGLVLNGLYMFNFYCSNEAKKFGSFVYN